MFTNRAIRTTHLMLAGALLAAATGCVAVVDETRPHHPYPVPSPPPPPADTRVEIGGDASLFYDDLAPYGRWVAMPEYGWVWIPRVGSQWAPYTAGRWVYTDDGWAWDADEEWGWAPFHYGRWYDDARYGWTWVPGSTWAPAWVAWREGDGVVGWAPLPPRARLDGDFERLIAPRHWCFVDQRYITAPAVQRHFVPRERAVAMVHATRDATHYTVTDNRVIDHGVDVRRVEQATDTRIRPVRVVDAAGPKDTHANSRELRVFRPRAEDKPAATEHRATGKPEPAPAAAAKDETRHARHFERKPKAADDKDDGHGDGDDRK